METRTIPAAHETSWSTRPLPSACRCMKTITVTNPLGKPSKYGNSRAPRPATPATVPQDCCLGPSFMDRLRQMRSLLLPVQQDRDRLQDQHTCEKGL